MRYKLLLLALPVLLAAARPHTDPVVKSGPPAAKPAGNSSVFARFNLAPFWRMPANGQSDEAVHNGFFSASFQRLELVFTSVQRDATSPNIYHVSGKDRRYGIVRKFAGTFTLDDIRPDAAAVLLSDEYKRQAYVATGKFMLRETARPGDEAYGTFRGRLAADFSQLNNGRLRLNQQTANEKTMNGGFILDGTWKDAGTGAEVDILAKNGWAVTYQVLEDFDIGGRSPHISRKYTRVGWSSYWANDEWWAEKTVARK